MARISLNPSKKKVNNVVSTEDKIQKNLDNNLLSGSSGDPLMDGSSATPNKNIANVTSTSNKINTGLRKNIQDVVSATPGGTAPAPTTPTTGSTGFGASLRNRIERGDTDSAPIETETTPAEKPSAIDRSKRLLEDITRGMDPVTQQLLTGQRESGQAQSAAEQAAQRQRLEQRGVSAGVQEAAGQQLQRQQREGELEETRQIGEQLARRQEGAIQQLANVERLDDAKAKELYNELKETTDWGNPESEGKFEQAVRDLYGEDFDVSGFIKEKRRQTSIKADKELGAYLLDNVSNMTLTDPSTGAFAGYNYSDPNVKNLIQDAYDARNPGGLYDFSEGEYKDWDPAQQAYADNIMKSNLTSAKHKELDAKYNTWLQDNPDATPEEIENKKQLLDHSKEMDLTWGYSTETFGDSIVTRGPDGSVVHYEGGKPEDVQDFGGKTFVKDGNGFKGSDGRSYRAEGDNIFIDGVKYGKDEVLGFSGPLRENAEAFLKGTDVQEAEVAEDYIYGQDQAEDLKAIGRGDNKAIEAVVNKVVKDYRSVDNTEYRALWDSPDARAKLEDSAKEISTRVSGNAGNRENRLQLEIPSEGTPFKIAGKTFVSASGRRNKFVDGKFGSEYTVLDPSTGEEFVINTFNMKEVLSGRQEG